MQRMKGQGNQVPNGPREQTNYASYQNYSNPNVTPSMAGASDPYMSSYYMTSPYQAFGVGDGTWNNGSEHMQTFLGGYSGQIGYDSHNTIDGVFNSVNYSGFNGPAAAPNFNYGFHGNGDYSAWGSSDVRGSGAAAASKTYDDYYQRNVYPDNSNNVKGLEHGVQELSLSEQKSIQDVNSKQPNSSITANGSGYGKSGNNANIPNVVDNHSASAVNQQSKKTVSWASVASQPAKAPPSRRRDKITLSSLVPGRHMDIGTWESKNGGPKPVAPPPAPRPAWDAPRGGSRATTSISYTTSPPQTPPQPTIVQQSPPSPHQNSQPTPPPVNHHSPQSSLLHQQSIDEPPPRSSTNLSPCPPHLQASQQNSNDSLDSSSPRSTPVPSSVAVSPSGGRSPLSQKESDDLLPNDYNPEEFDLSPKDARFFVIKSYSEDDIHRSIKYKIWCSTEHGNKRLDAAFREREGKGPIFLFFSVNGSGHFCGIAQMLSQIDYNSTSTVWAQDKWKGQFRVKWIYVKDVPNMPLRHIRLENNENKPVTNSRDTQEVPYEKGIQVMKIIHTFPHTTSIFDDFIHYEKRQEETEFRRGHHQTYREQNEDKPRNNNYNRGDYRGDPRGGDPRNGPRGDPRGGDPRNGPRGDPRGYEPRGGGGYRDYRPPPPHHHRDYYHPHPHRGGHGGGRGSYRGHFYSPRGGGGPRQ